ncbi:hypothetical protein H4R18_001164 [Coemansia javaensis]|uniref:Enoyl reductase (ER) domain-containing protein n=1 Tax=Coemansia javaensis TaxID=2761396 RepID=A0A9W8HGB6_9FUNG|nr:hypothetical protein H4R18_001164 [Coemansia javaensis]
MAAGTFSEIRGWAAMKPGMQAEPWSYTPRPLGSRDVEIKIEFSGICGSDIHLIRNDWGFSQYPQIAGHEIVGKVVAKGPGVKHFELGDTVGVGAIGAYTILGKYPDGVSSQGGFAEAVRVHEHFASKIPAAIDPAHAPPLMCAGVTVFAPMVKNGVKRGDRVGVVGIGGLGHLAIQFAAALGAEVVAISHSPSKREQCMELGVTQFVDTSNREEAEALRKSLDFLFVCSTAGAEKYNEFITWMACESQIVILGLPSEPLKVYPGELVFSGTSISGSQIGGLSMTRKTLEFAAKHNIRPMIERFPIAKINEAMEHVESGKVRYRAVLEL